MEDRPRVSTLINSLANYSNTIQPTPADPDAKPSQAGASRARSSACTCPASNIFGVILFIRLTWVVGTAGAVAGFMIVLTCCCVVSIHCLMF